MIYKTKKLFNKKIFVLVIILLIILIFGQFSHIVYADNEGEVYNQLSQTVKDNLNNLDLSNLDEIVNSLDSDIDLFGGNFKDKVINILNGSYFNEYDNIFKAIINLFFGGLKSFAPLLLMIIAVAILFNILTNLKSGKFDGVGNVVYFACFGVIVLIMSVAFTKIIATCGNAINLLKTQMDIIFPILLTLLTAVGGVASTSVYKPIVSVLAGAVVTIFNSLLYPIFILSFIFLILGNMSPNIKLSKFSSFLSSCFKWIVGFVFTLFSAFLSIQGISAGKFDGVSIKATKFAVKSYIPILGGYLSDGLDFVLLSSILIKNAIGVGGLLLIIATILSPIITMVVFKLGLSLTAALLEPIGDGKISNFVHSCSKILIYPIVILLAISFMYLISIALIMCTANVI